ncbi:uncharacterized protein NEMAJ01_1618 [Nematocida major]|uniref:uncharacterized protein n=1 Tax=Nematocida major TaxID=1912982 RepID=UPI0020080D2D|nr:uncharacterized protein NEMAJ01_1618 [Nematocida major]KAH9386722.1 hypothetical protein NEMAJ01_1618 [Nematocida major]
MQVFYRFRSERDFSKVETDRSSMPLWELKAEIATKRNLTLHDYHLIFYVENEKAPITDNYAVIYSNMNIVIERVPNYINVGYKEALEKMKQPEEAAKKQEETASISMHSMHGARVPPESYTCFRCGQKGHFIQMCPTNSNKQYDSMRIKKATGIPKTFLVPVEETSPTSVLLNEEGKFVRAQPQTKEFSRRFKPAEERSIPKELQCPQCNNLLVDAVKLKCKHTVCEYCVLNRCPVCKKKTASPKIDTKARRHVEAFLENSKA